MTRSCTKRDRFSLALLSVMPGFSPDFLAYPDPDRFRCIENQFEFIEKDFLFTGSDLDTW